MFTRIFISISFLLVLTACQNPPTAQKSNTNQKQSEEKLQSNEKSKPEMQAWQSDEEAVAFLKKYGKANQENTIRIETKFGEILIRLYTNTPVHRANMVYLIKEHQYFNGTWFHRVSKGHVIQAGNNDEYTLQQLRDKIGKYELPTEASGENYHKYGSVAMARSYHDNPEKQSDPFEFYINLGQVYSSAQLDAMEEEYDIKLNPKQRSIYSSIGGSPHLDHEHTVIGEVIEGMEVVEAISKVQTDKGEWPLENIPIEVFIEK
jgi:peptidyl-prolyl cis-trans isomerase B (cyclophilin B)